MSIKEPDQILDATGLNCPLPLLKAKKALNQLASGQVLKVIATDKGSVRDFKVFAEQSGHTLLSQWEQQATYFYLLEKSQ